MCEEKSFDIDIHGMVTENENNKQTSLENKEVEPVEPAQMNIYQSNAYTKNLGWLHFYNEPRV